ncbi:hypothetical protein LX32DRAFT_649005 [Colletotrichum zoysiae]|uniref:RRM domain-containing protein n=1 Tax=Colletotrichum zoysiae TaxID=1216348 RepID=A0AAD9HRA0_9PEZI|nr:hypothetical protein LX32DRAFT_649005 [Colletotrichum zoysiae]
MADTEARVAATAEGALPVLPSEAPRQESLPTDFNSKTSIVVERLTKNINEDHLEEIFGQYGRIKDLDLPINRTHGTNRGTAYILYETEADAEEAIAHMHEAQLDGAVINHLPWPVGAEVSIPEALLLEVVVVEAWADPTAVEEGLAFLARMDPDEVHRLRRLGLVHDQTPTDLVRYHVPRHDPLGLLRRPEVVVADTEAAPGPTPDLLRRLRDVEVGAEATTAIAGDGVRAATAMTATIAVGLGLLAEAATVVAAEAAVANNAKTYG